MRLCVTGCSLLMSVSAFQHHFPSFQTQISYHHDTFYCHRFQNPRDSSTEGHAAFHSSDTEDDYPNFLPYEQPGSSRLPKSAPLLFWPLVFPGWELWPCTREAAKLSSHPPVTPLQNQNNREKHPAEACSRWHHTWEGPSLGNHIKHLSPSSFMINLSNKIERGEY